MMETTFMRGFSNSFLPQIKTDVVEEQLVESCELERAWKAARRQRLRAQEDNIWQTFVQEQDPVLDSVKNDPYQFLQQLPPTCLQQLIDTQLSPQAPKLGGGDSPRSTEQQLVSFTDLTDRDSEVFHIFSDDNLNQKEQPAEVDQDKQESGQEEEDEGDCLNDSVDTARTVRERSPQGEGEGDWDGDGTASPPACRHSPRQRSPTDKCESVGRLVESSIYCAKVKDARDQIRDEMKAIVSTLEGLNISGLEMAEVRKMIRRATEFTARLKPIQMHHTKRQINTIRRHISLSLPLGKHTQFHSQLRRADCLHRSLLQALQVLHRTLTATACLGDSGGHLTALVQGVRNASVACRAISVPADCAQQADDLFNDEVEEACVALEAALTVYNIRVSSTVAEVHCTQVSDAVLCQEVEEACVALEAALTVYNIRVSSTVAEVHCTQVSDAVLCQEVEEACVALEAALTVYNIRVSSTVAEVHCTQSSARSGTDGGDGGSGVGGRGAGGGGGGTNKSVKVKRRSWGPLNKPKPDMKAASAKLSMYSLETARKPSRHNNASKARADSSAADKLTTDEDKSAKKKLRRPLMRDPQSGQPRRPRGAREQDPPTMVEGVHVPSSNVSISPTRRRRAPRAPGGHSPRRAAPLTPLSPRTPRTARTDTSRSTHVAPSSPVTLVQQAKGKKSARGEKRAHGETVPGAGAGAGAGATVAPGDTAAAQRRPNDGLPSSAAQQPAGAEPPSPVAAVNPPAPARTSAPAAKQTDECEVTRLLRQLCGGDKESYPCNARERSSGTKNAQLLYVNGYSPRQHSTPQLLKILEETIQKKAVVAPLLRKPSRRDHERLRLAFNIPAASTDSVFQYRTRFLQHMLQSPLYANGAVHRPWELIGSVSEQLIDELLAGLVKEMELRELVEDIYFTEVK